MMANFDLHGKKVAILATDYYEQDELTKPLEALQAAGADVDIIAPHSGQIKGLKHVEPGRKVSVTKVLDEARPEQYDALVLPGGAVNADQIRMSDKARQFVKTIFDAGKPLAAICHAPWLLVSAGIVKGKRLTSYFTVQDDIRNAGGEWIDQQVVRDGNLITSRQPDDLAAFNDALLSALAV